jgi:hypothetical protein
MIARGLFEIGGLVVVWVATSEYPLLYVFVYFFTLSKLYRGLKIIYCASFCIMLFIMWI